MADSESGTSDEASYIPDFERPHYGAIREDNWLEYEARGFIPDETESASYYVADIGQRVATARSVWGMGNVYTGDAWDAEADRPLRHKPGTSIYIDVEKHFAETREDKDYRP